MAQEIFESCSVSLRDDGQQCILCVSGEREPAEDRDQHGLVVCAHNPCSTLLGGKLTLRASTRSTGECLFTESLLAFFAKHTSAHSSKQQEFSLRDEPNKEKSLQPPCIW